jgi:hypothetical protein
MIRIPSHPSFHVTSAEVGRQRHYTESRSRRGPRVSIVKAAGQSDFNLGKVRHRRVLPPVVSAFVPARVRMHARGCHARRRSRVREVRAGDLGDHDQAFGRRETFANLNAIALVKAAQGRRDGPSRATIGGGVSGGIVGRAPRCRGARDEGPVAQWQSRGLITPRSQVRTLPGPPRWEIDRAIEVDSSS